MGEAVDIVPPAILLQKARHANARDGMRASFEMMVDLLKKQGVGYDEFVLSL